MSVLQKKTAENIQTLHDKELIIRSAHIRIYWQTQWPINIKNFPRPKTKNTSAS